MADTNTAVLATNKKNIVAVKVKVDGEVIPREYHLVSVTVQQEVNKIPVANLVIFDGEASSQEFPVSSSGTFDAGKKIEIEYGYLDDDDSKTENFFFTGIIVSLTHRISNYCCELNLECKDETVKMTINKESKSFDKNITASEIADVLLKKNKIEGADTGNATVKHEQVMQSSISDWDFMIGRLDMMGFMCVIYNGKVNIRQPKPDDPTEGGKKKTLLLEHGKNILEFNADSDSRIRHDSVKTVTWNFKEQTTNETTNDEKPVSDNNSSDPPVSSSYNMSTAANLTDEEQKAIEKAKSIRLQLSVIKGKIKFNGRTDILVLPGDFIELKGAGKKFDGYHFVSAVQNEYADGDWTTETTLGWTEKFFSEQVNPTHPSASIGQPSSMQGLQIGVVTSIEDSDGQYRVQVRLPVVDNKADGLHARVATLDAGDKRGTYFRPEIGDEVVIGFINDDPSNPVILGMLHSQGIPSPFEPEKKNDQKGYVSRSEIKLVFHDGDKSVRIETPGKRIFEMNDKNGTISLKDNDGNKIVMEQKGVTIEAAQEIKIKAGTSLSIEAMNISIKADASLEAKGSASAKFEGSGMAEIKGGIVKIN